MHSLGLRFFYAFCDDWLLRRGESWGWRLGCLSHGGPRKGLSRSGHDVIIPFCSYYYCSRTHNCYGREAINQRLEAA